MGAQTPVTVPPPKPKVVAKPEEKPSLIGRVFGRKSKEGEAAKPEAAADTKKSETTKKPAEPAAPKAEEKTKAKTTEAAAEKPKRRARVTKTEPKEEAKPAPKAETEPKEEAKPAPKAEEKPVAKEEPKEETKPAPTEEPKTTATPKPAAEEKTQASTKKGGKKGATAAKPAATKVDTSHMDDGAKFRVTKAAAQEDPAIKELKAKADSAISESEAHSATVAYNRALFRKIRDIEPSLDGYVDQMESAMMKRLSAEKKSE